MFVLIMIRDFLLFLPSTSPSLKAILSYYSATANVNHEGDVHVNDTLQGLGKYIPAPGLEIPGCPHPSSSARTRPCFRVSFK